MGKSTQPQLNISFPAAKLALVSQSLNSAIRSLLRHPAHFPALSTCVTNLGLWNYKKAVDAYHRRAEGTSGAEIELSSSYCLHPLSCRRGTHDFDVFLQIFMEREYGCLDRLKGVHSIVDCGANVGYSSAYFLSIFPEARVIAIEPDPGNFETLRRNLAPFGERAVLLQTGLWSHPTELRISNEVYRTGGSWARQVCECAPGETGFQAVDMNTLIARTGRDRIDLLKIDIEGAEAVVFAAGCERWLDKVGSLVIELHDDSSFGDGRSLVKRVMHEAGFTETESGELSVFQRPG